MKQLLNSLLSLTLLSGCATFNDSELNKPPIVAPTPLQNKLTTIPELDGEPIYIGVNSFKDLTGARKQADNYASFSSAVTQGGEAWLIESLLESNGWFKVLERGPTNCDIKATYHPEFADIDEFVKKANYIKSVNSNNQCNIAFPVEEKLWNKALELIIEYLAQDP